MPWSVHLCRQMVILESRSAKQHLSMCGNHNSSSGHIWEKGTWSRRLKKKDNMLNSVKLTCNNDTQTTLSSSHHWGLISSVSFSNPCHSDTLCWKRLGKEGIMFKSPERRALPALQGHQETWSWFRQFHPSCQHPLSVIGEILFPNQTAKGFKDFAKE